MKQRICKGCGKPLDKPRPNQQYHDDRCKHTAYRARDDLVKPLASPLVVLAGVDTLYLNVYYANPERYTRIERRLDESLQDIFTDMQQRLAKRL